MTRTISFTLNGESVAAEIKPHHNLVEVLQREFNLMGARESCGQGMCGCCTVLVNGTAVSGCLYLAAFLDARKAAMKAEQGHQDTSRVDTMERVFLRAGNLHLDPPLAFKVYGDDAMFSATSSDAVMFV